MKGHVARFVFVDGDSVMVQVHYTLSGEVMHMDLHTYIKRIAEDAIAARFPTAPSAAATMAERYDQEYSEPRSPPSSVAKALETIHQKRPPILTSIAPELKDFELMPRGWTREGYFGDGDNYYKHTATGRMYKCQSAAEAISRHALATTNTSC